MTQQDKSRAAFEAHTDLLTYVLQDYIHNRLTPRVIDIAYTAFMAAKQPNTEDGGPTDWFNDTKPVVMKAIEKLRKDLFADRQQRGEPVAVADLPSFPTMLRKMWSGGEVQEWINDNLKPLFQERHHDYHCAPQPAEPVKGPSDEELLDFYRSHAGYEVKHSDVRALHIMRSLLDRYQGAQPAASAEPIITLAGFDEYGPLLDWHKHWVNFPVGKNFYAAPVAAQPSVPDGVRPPEIQAAWHAGWDAAQEAWKTKSLPVTPQEDEAWEELEKRQ